MLKRIWRGFQLVSCLKVNLAKSVLLEMGCRFNIVQLWEINCIENWNSPVYLS